MLKKINAGKIESDEGFFVVISGPEELKYTKNDRFLFLDWTLNSKNQIISIYLTDAKSWSGPDRKIITAAEKKEIFNNLSRAVKLLDGEFKII